MQGSAGKLFIARATSCQAIAEALLYIFHLQPGERGAPAGELGDGEGQGVAGEGGWWGERPLARSPAAGWWRAAAAFRSGVAGVAAAAVETS